MKVIFLDVDGVLNDSWFVVDTRSHGPVELDERKIKLLKKIVDATDSLIVLSSTWRKCYRKHIENVLSNFGLRIFSCTPISLEGKRWKEIENWLSDRPEVENFVILDDETDMCEKFDNYLINTDYFDGGLNEGHVSLAIRKLNLK